MDIKKLAIESGLVGGYNKDATYAEWNKELNLFAQKIIEACDAEWMEEPAVYMRGKTEQPNEERNRTMDQCAHCTMRGNLKGCLKTTCNQHESWMVLQLREENDKLREKMRTAAWALNQTRADLEGTPWPNSGMATGE